MRRFHSIGVLFAVFALVVRAAIPVGWMPNTAGIASGVPIVFCTHDGPKTALVDLNWTPGGEHHQPAQGPGEHHQVCPFAAAGTVAPPAAAPLIVAALDAEKLALRSESSFEVRTARRDLPQPRAPPLKA